MIKTHLDILKDYQKVSVEGRLAVELLSAKKTVGTRIILESLQNYNNCKSDVLQIHKINKPRQSCSHHLDLDFAFWRST